MASRLHDRGHSRGQRSAPAESAAEPVGLTCGAVTPEQRREVRASWSGWGMFHAAVIVGVVAAVYIAVW